MRRIENLREHFENSYVAEPNSGCWLWTGYVAGNGYGIIYGRFPDGTHQQKAHRYGYQLIRGEVPSGLQLDHKCRTRCCVNPDHLEPVTQQENMRRGERYRALVTGTCKYGHPVRVVTQYGGKRSRCSTCQAKWKREWEARQ